MEEKVAAIIAALRERYPDALCALHYGKDYELMISVRLSAQCTDARVNQVTPALFARFPTLEAFAEADVAEVEAYVRSCRLFPPQGAGHRGGPAGCSATSTAGACRTRWSSSCGCRASGGRRPTCCWATSTANRPSCATRTASASQTASGWPAARSRRRSSGQLRAILPPEESSDFCHRIVLFGREVCTARSPHCDRCELRPYCREFSGE